MNCKEIQDYLIHYIANEVSPSQRTLIHDHLARCEACQNELESLSALQSRIGASLHRTASQSNPSPQAWSRIQAKLAKEARPKPESITSWKDFFGQIIFKGGALMRKPAYAIAIILALIISVTAGVPSVRAQVQETFQNLFFKNPGGSGIIGIELDWEYVPFNPTFMREGWEAAKINLGEGDVRFFGILYTYHGSQDIANGFVALIQRRAADIT
jgi:hypothetical protein